MQTDKSLILLPRRLQTIDSGGSELSWVPIKLPVLWWWGRVRWINTKIDIVEENRWWIKAKGIKEQAIEREGIEKNEEI